MARPFDVVSMVASPLPFAIAAAKAIALFICGPMRRCFRCGVIWFRVIYIIIFFFSSIGLFYILVCWLFTGWRAHRLRRRCALPRRGTVWKRRIHCSPIFRFIRFQEYINGSIRTTLEIFCLGKSICTCCSTASRSSCFTVSSWHKWKRAHNTAKWRMFAT